MAMPSLDERIGRFFAVDDPWERQGGLDRRDLVVGLATLAFSAVTFELTRSAGALQDVRQPTGEQWLAVVLGAVILVGRRWRPLTVTVLASAHMFVVGVTMPAVMAQLSMQIVYFVAIFSGVAWARSRRDTLVVVGAVLIFMFVWLAWHFAVGSGVDEAGGDCGDCGDCGDDRGGTRAGPGRRASRGGTAHRTGEAGPRPDGPWPVQRRDRRRPLPGRGDREDACLERARRARCQVHDVRPHDVRPKGLLC